MEVSVQLQADAAAALERRSTATAEIEQLCRQLEELGVVLRPVHPGVEDPLLAPQFVVDVEADEELAERVLAVLRESPVVEAAYTKPAAELP